MSNAPALTAKGLSKQFGRHIVWRNLSFEVPDGAQLAIFGANGAGKTTLLRIIATLEKPSAGTMTVNGFDTRKQADNARASIGLLSHAPMLYPDLTALENLQFTGELYGVSDPTARAKELLEMVGLAHRRLDAVRTFSRGMTQRIALARALVADPRIVLLDEPYSGLDPRAAASLDSLITQTQADHTFIMVSHDLHKGLSMCTHVLTLPDGTFTTREERDEADLAALFDGSAAPRPAATGKGAAR